MSKRFSIIIIDGKEYIFNPEKFRKLMDNKKRAAYQSSGKRIFDSQIYNELSELIYSTPEAIKNWKLGRNGPEPGTDIEAILHYFDAKAIEMFDPADAIIRNDRSVLDRAEVNRVFTECMNILFRITRFEPEEGEGTRKQQENKNAQNAVNEVRFLDQSVYSHSLFISSDITNRLHRLLKDFRYMAESRLWDNPWEEREDRPVEVKEYESDVHDFQFFLCDTKRSICKDSPDIDGVSYIFDEIDYADDLGLENTVVPDDYFYEHCDDSDVILKYGYQGECEITPTMVYDHILTKYMSAVFRYYFPEFFEGEIK